MLWLHGAGVGIPVWSQGVDFIQSRPGPSKRRLRIQLGPCQRPFPTTCGSKAQKAGSPRRAWQMSPSERASCSFINDTHLGGGSVRAAGGRGRRHE